MRHPLHHPLLPTLGLCLAFAAHAAGPDIALSLTPEGALRHRVTLDGTEIVAPSPLGITLDGAALGENETELSRRTEGDLTTLTLRNASGRRWVVEARAFPDGVAIRYRIPADGPATVSREATAFTFPSGTTAWYASAVFQYGYTQRYQERKTDAIAGEILAPPATFRLPNGTYAALTEGNLRDFHGCAFEGTAPNVVSVLFAECKGALDEGIAVGMPRKDRNVVVRNRPWQAIPKRGTQEIVTPWRILMVARDLDGLVRNGILAQVADPPDPALFPNGGREPWIRPARAVWTWLLTRPNRQGFDTCMDLIEDAHALGYEALVIDEGWERWPTRDGLDKWAQLAKLCAHARTRGVDVWVWRPGAPRREGDGQVLDPAERARFMDACAKAGVRGLKIDFLHRENLPTVQAMEAILEDAAKRRLMVVFHGVNKPTGDAHTWPNLLAKEAVSGLECVGSAQRNMAPWPVHDATLPFTRWLAGPADYTPVGFGRRCPASTTYAHQAATAVAFTSPMLILAADPKELIREPLATHFRDLPVTWDETRVLAPSAIGRLAILARRHGDEWWVAILNGADPRTLTLPLRFLGDGHWTLDALEDAAPDRRTLTRRQSTHTAADTLTLPLLPGGGALLRLTPRAPSPSAANAPRLRR